MSPQSSALKSATAADSVSLPLGPQLTILKYLPEEKIKELRQLELMLRCKAKEALENLELISLLAGKDLSLHRERILLLKQELGKELANVRKGFDLCDSAVVSRDLSMLLERQELPSEIIKLIGNSELQKNNTKRKAVIRALKSRAVIAFEQAEANNSHLSPKQLKTKKRIWAADLIKIDRVCQLFEKGFSASRIKSLTGVNAPSWLHNSNLPPELGRASRKIIKHDFVIPVRINSDLAYVIGVYAAVTRSFNSKSPIVVKSESRQKLEKFRSAFKQAFLIDIPDPVYSDGVWCQNICREAFMPQFHTLIGVVSDKDIKVPWDVLKYPSNTEPFLDGFVDYSRGSFAKGTGKFSVSRNGQLALMKAVAIAMYYAGMLPSISIQGERTNLRLWSTLDQECLRARSEGVSQIVKGSKDAEGLLASVNHYYRVMEVFRQHYPPARKLDFADVLTKAGIDFKPDQITASIKDKLQDWRRGDKPYNVVKAETIESYINEMYG